MVVLWTTEVRTLHFIRPSFPVHFLLLVYPVYDEVLLQKYTLNSTYI
jgi:hypothetical protein